MINRSRIKIIVVVVLLAGLSVALYLRRPKSGWDPGWDKGLASSSERNFYYQRMNRIIEDWQNTKRTAERYDDSRLKESYNTYLVVDMDRKALWIEEAGRIRAEDYIDFPKETKWIFNHYTPKGETELTGRTMLKIRGFNTDRNTREQFCLIGRGTGGYLALDFNASSKGGPVGPGTLNKPSFTFPSSSASDDNSYGSILVTEEEYKQYRDSLPESGTVVTEDENRKVWSRIQKYLYMEIERQMASEGFELRNVSFAPGPDYSAAHAEIKGRNDNIVQKILGGPSSVDVYLKMDYLGNDIWYAKSTVNPEGPSRIGPTLDLEFLISPEGKVANSLKTELLKKGRDIQKTSMPESKWKATLSNGTTIEFLGICNALNPDTQWWGPDGSLLNYVPNYNTELYNGAGEEKVCEFVWRMMPPDSAGNSRRYSVEGSRSISSRRILDRYGSRAPRALHSDVCGFDKSQQITTFGMGFAFKEWKTPLVIKDEAGEINFLDKQKIILNPPVIENGQIIIRCYEETGKRIIEYKTDFAIIVNDGSTTKTVTLDEYGASIRQNPQTGLLEHKYTIKDLSLSQIEGVCLRYRPCSFVIFKNISLVPGKNQGFEIEVQEAEEK